MIFLQSSFLPFQCKVLSPLNKGVGGETMTIHLGNDSIKRDVLTVE